MVSLPPLLGDLLSGSQPVRGDPVALAAAAGAFGAAGSAVGDVSAAVTAHYQGIADWESTAAGSARAAGSALTRDLATATRALTDAATVLSALAAAIADAKTREQQAATRLHYALPQNPPGVLENVLSPAGIISDAQALAQAGYELVGALDDAATARQRAAAAFDQIGRRSWRMPSGVAGNHVISPLQKLLLGSLPNDSNQLNAEAESRISDRLAKLSSGDQQRFLGLLDQAQSSSETAYLWKALAADRSVNDISAFATTIRGKDPEWLQVNLTLANADLLGGVESGQLAQQWNASCVATTTEAAHGYIDPIYALWLHGGGPTDVTEDEITSTAHEPNPRLSSDQKKILESHGGQAALGSHPGAGTSDDEWVKEMNQLASITGVTYHHTSVDPGDRGSVNAGLREMEHGLDRGLPVPFGVGGADGGHAVVALARRGPMILVYDPGYGNTGWISEDQFRNQQLDHFADGTPGGTGGWSQFQGVVAPNG